MERHVHFHPKSFSTTSAVYLNLLLGSSSSVAVSENGGKCASSDGSALTIDLAT